MPTRLPCCRFDCEDMGHLGPASPGASPQSYDTTSDTVSLTATPTIWKGGADPLPPKKRIRKSRSRGLRTKTGCLTCRKRHKKCDEKSPICGPCSISNRGCIYADGAESMSIPHPTHSHNSSTLQTIKESIKFDTALGPSHSQPSPHIAPSPNSFISSVDGSISHHNALPSQYGIQVEKPYFAGYSPETVSAESLSADSASTRWLDLLASDAAQADGEFSLVSSPESISKAKSCFENEKHHLGDSDMMSDTPVSERHAWQSEQSISLSSHETILFRNFAERAALWLDMHDSEKNFSTHATRLALRNVGLMKAILALAARHNAMIQASLGRGGVDNTNEAIQYYYETLHYIQNALRYNSYAHSEELLGTALVISTYEMLNASDSNWQRHLKGVFWIQRSQDVNGASGGLRQSVWWAWLRQDYWAAFRERRRCFSFWKPVQDYPELSQEELARRSVYLLSQTVNYCANPDASSSDPDIVARRAEAGGILMGMLERWKSFLGDKFQPLPTTPRYPSMFEPLWIHPPHFASAVQVYHFARILITLHRPAMAGFDGYMRMQRILSEAVTTICGIAMELTDEACQLLSAQCLFGAGLCVQDENKRRAIISLIDACEARTGWPMASLKADLWAEWAKIRR
ncbi:hypothetical protein F5Y16DRAFT_386693 [Xylariaceae sp. FL0255]|nr:hypothetical protein F5Y16DRAFT_386693 [Xylariaceae sp. FL0255]